MGSRIFSEKGQVSIFVIVAILLVVIIGFILYFNYGDIEGGSSELSYVRDLVFECVEDLSESGVYLIGLQGGYFENEELNVYYNDHNIPYYWYDSKDHMPSIERVELELGKFMKENIESCISGIEGVSIENKEIDVESEIKKEEVEFDIEFKLSVSKGELAEEFRDFSTVVGFPVDKAVRLAGEIMVNQEKFGNEVPIGKLIEIADSENIEFETVYIGDDDVMYSLIMDKSERPFIWNFAADYDWEDRE